MTRVTLEIELMPDEDAEAFVHCIRNVIHDSDAVPFDTARVVRAEVVE